MRRRWRRSRASSVAAARRVAARAVRSSASASPITWATSAISATTAASRSASRSSRGSRKTCCARTPPRSATGWLMDCVVPGGVARDLGARALTAIRDQCARPRARNRTLRGIYDEHAGLQDRFRTCGRVTPELARDARPDRARGARERPGVRRCAATFPSAPYDALGARKVAAHRRRRRRARRACASTSSPSRCASSRAIVDAHARGRRRASTSRAAAGGRARPRATSRAGAGRCWSRSKRARRRDPPLPSARPVVAELAGARARGDRQHRSRLPADQQVVQPFVQRPRPLRPCCRSSGRSRRSASGAERRAAPADEHVVVARLQADDRCASSGAR